MPVALEPFLKHVPAFMLVLFRITGIFVLAPVLGGRTLPMRVKVLLAFGLALCVYPAFAPVAGLSAPGTPVHEAAADVLSRGTDLSPWALPGLIAMELLIGFVIGFGATLPLIGFQMSGRIIDQQMGLGIGEFFNPELNDSTGVLGQFFFITAITLFMMMDGHRILLMVLVGSFDAVPLGGFRADASLLNMALGLMLIMLELAMRVAGPILCLIFLETMAMGFIARTVPQLNILSIGFPLRILIGLALLVGCFAIGAEAFMDTLTVTFNRITQFFAP